MLLTPNTVPASLTRRQVLTWGAAATTALSGSLACAADPAPVQGTLTLVVGYAPGGATDRAARLIGEHLRAHHGLNVIVDNRTGAGGRIAAQQVKRTSADQNVLLLANPATMVIAPVVFKDAGYDPEKDFVPVSQVSEYQFAIAVGTSIPLKEVNHLFAWLRSNPDRANFGVPATGSLPHFFSLMVAEQAKVSPQIIGYKGSAPLQTDVIGGQVPVAIDTLDSLYALHQAGKLRILASSGEQRASFARDIPTFREAGLKLSANGWNTFFAPVQMPSAKVQWLVSAIRAAMQEPSIRQAFEKVFMTPVITNQEETRRALAQFRAQWLPVVQRTHFEP